MAKLKKGELVMLISAQASALTRIADPADVKSALQYLVDNWQLIEDLKEQVDAATRG